MPSRFTALILWCAAEGIEKWREDINTEYSAAGYSYDHDDCELVRRLFE